MLRACYRQVTSAWTVTVEYEEEGEEGEEEESKWKAGRRELSCEQLEAS